ncbi:MAG: hypothetical protein K2Z81_00370, partial [Cyanobacteria bacterium]|nr:hypothetical protein [Cyanobacteriota bacterium]
MTIQTNFNNGSINLNNGSIFANGIVSLTTEGTGTLTVGAGKTLSSTGNDISITSAGVSLTGTLNAGATGKVSITPTNTSSSIGVNGGAGTIQVTGLSQITADTLEIGAPSLTGKITVNSAGTPLNASYNLTFTGNTADSNNAFQSNDAINMGGKTLVINVGGAATLDDITGTANIVVVNARSISADTVTLTGGASVLSMNGTTGIVQTGGPFTAGSASLTALGGAAGTVTTPLNTATSSLTTNAFESNISNTGVLNGLTASSTTTLKVVNDNSITVSGGGITAGGALTLTTSANNGNIDINSSSVSSSGGLIQLTTDGSGAVQVNAFGLVSTTGGNDITLTSSSISIAATGSVNSGTGLVTLRPVNTASTIGVAGGAGTFQLTAPTLSQITAKTIVIGQATGTGNIQVGAGASLTKDITFLSNTGDFVNPGTISIGSNLTVTTTSGTITTGKINGAANTVTLTGKLIIAGDINLSGASTITMHATGAKGAGSITNPGATITAATISLTSDNDFIGSDDGTTQFQTASGSLSAAAGGGICIANTGALTSFTSSTSSRLDFFNNNTINIGAAGVNSSGPVTIATFANNGSIIANNGSITTGASAISLSTVGT